MGYALGVKFSQALSGSVPRIGTRVETHGPSQWIHRNPSISRNLEGYWVSSFATRCNHHVHSSSSKKWNKFLNDLHFCSPSLLICPLKQLNRPIPRPHPGTQRWWPRDCNGSNSTIVSAVEKAPLSCFWAQSVVPPENTRWVVVGHASYDQGTMWGWLTTIQNRIHCWRTTFGYTMLYIHQNKMIC